jgi:hypothetical protein
MWAYSDDVRRSLLVPHAFEGKACEPFFSPSDFDDSKLREMLSRSQSGAPQL